MKTEFLQVGPIGTNCFLLESETNSRICVIVDPGAEGARIASLAEKAGRTPAVILLTHGHYDHTDGVAELRKKWPEIPVYLNSRDVYGGAGTRMDAQIRQLFPPLAGVRNYDEGDVLQFAEDIVIQVLATPGHTEGSVTLLCGRDMFCGDTLFAGSCGRVDFPGGDPHKMLASLYRLSALPGDYRVWPGHEGMSTLERERQRNPYVRQAMRELGGQSR